MRNWKRGAAAAALGVLVCASSAAADGPKKWTGAFVGANIGWSTGSVDHAQTNGGMTYGPFNYDADGLTAGAVLGYNMQFQQIVAGIEAEGGYMDLSGEGRIPSSDPAHHQALDVDGGFYGLIAGRLGLAWDRTLIYGKAGYAYLDGDAGQKTTKPGYVTHRSGAFQGLAYGAGLEHAMTDRVSVRFEWLRFDFDAVTGSQESVADDPVGYRYTNKTDLSTDSFKIGVNYKLN